jgi:hypothetical protein
MAADLFRKEIGESADTSDGDRPYDLFDDETVRSILLKGTYPHVLQSKLFCYNFPYLTKYVGIAFTSGFHFAASMASIQLKTPHTGEYEQPTGL